MGGRGENGKGVGDLDRGWYDSGEATIEADECALDNLPVDGVVGVPGPKLDALELDAEALPRSPLCLLVPKAPLTLVILLLNHDSGSASSLIFVISFPSSKLSGKVGV